MAKSKVHSGEMPYETAKAALDKVILEIQQESISIDQLAIRIKQAQDLIKYCQAKLRNIEVEVNTLLGEEEE